MNYFTPQWPAIPRIRAYCTTRKGGFSSPPYDSFNLASHVGDDRETVERNRRKLIQDLKLPEHIHWLNQVHGTDVLKLDANTDWQTPVSADAVVTNQPGLVCCVLTADCLPLLVAEKSGKAIGAIHAGWKGLLAGVIQTGIEAMNCDPSNLQVWLGPAISQTHFQVDDDIRRQFLKVNPDYQKGFIEREGAIFCDLFALARIHLHRLGVQAIYGGNLCTFSNPDLFYSYRRDKNGTGRIASLIVIEQE